MTATIGGVAATRLHLSEGGGPWFLDADLIDDTTMSGRVDCVIAGTTLSGTINPFESGTFGAQRRVRVEAGAGGWGKLLRSRSYHNDAGVSAELVARDAALECGEQIGTFAPATPTLPVDFARDAGPGSRALEVIAGGFNWWVGRDGITNVGTRPAHTPTADSYVVLSHNPASNEAVIAVDALDSIRVGSALSAHLDTPQTVTALDVLLDGAKLRVRAWFGRGTVATSNLGDLLQAIIRRTTDVKLWGLYDYRVISMQDDRVNVQAINPDDGVPDMTVIQMSPGAPGIAAQLTDGAEVLVAFLAGDRARPRIVNFGGSLSSNYVPQSLTLLDGTRASSAQGDLVECPMLGVTVTFDVPPGGASGGIPIPLTTLTPYVLSFDPLIPPTPLAAGSLYGTIASGAPALLQP